MISVAFFTYRQRREHGELKVVLQSYVTLERIVLFHHQLDRTEDINPWLSLHAEVNSSIVAATQGFFELGVKFKTLNWL